MKLAGRVIDAKSETRISEAKVVLSIENREIAALETDQQGAFEFRSDEVPIGAVLTVAISTKGYRETSTDLHVDSSEIEHTLSLEPRRRIVSYLPPLVWAIVVVTLALGVALGIMKPWRDRQAPTVVGLTPERGQNAVPINADLIIEFSEPVRAGTGEIRVVPLAGAGVVSIGVPGDLVTIDERVVTIDPINPLPYGRTFGVQISAGSFQDETGSAYAGIHDLAEWSFATESEPDSTRPKAIGFSPSPGATGVPVDEPLRITFSEDVSAGAGTIRIVTADGDTMVSDIPVSSSEIQLQGRNAAIDLRRDLPFGTHIAILIGEGAFVDSSGNPCAGVGDTTEWSFTTLPEADTDQPRIAVDGLHPRDGEQNVALDAVLEVTFSEGIQRPQQGSVVITNEDEGSVWRTISILSSQASISDDRMTLTLRMPERFPEGATLSVQLPSQAILDMAGNALPDSEASPWTFSTTRIPPVVEETTPPNGELSVAPDSALEILFTEAVVTGAGDIVIWTEEPADYRREINVSSDVVTIVDGSTLRISPTEHLPAGTRVAVEIPEGIVTDEMETPSQEYSWGFSTSMTVWSTVISSLGADGVQGITLDASGHLLVSGFVQDGAMIGEEAGDLEGGIFLAKLDTEGPSLTLQANICSELGVGVVNEYAFRRTGDVYVTGSVYGRDAAFAARFAPGSSPEWTTLSGDTGDTGRFSGEFIELGPKGDVYIAGTMDDYWNATFAGEPVPFLTPDTHDTSTDMFAARLDGDTGSLHWVVSGGTTSMDFLNDMVLDSSGNMYIAVNARSDAFHLDGETSESEGRERLQLRTYIAKLDRFGRVKWTHTPLQPNGGTSSCRHLAVDDEGNVYAAGEFSGSIEWGSGMMEREGWYVARINRDGGAVWGQGLGGDVVIWDLATGPDGSVFLAGVGYSVTLSEDVTLRARYSDWEIAFVAQYDADGDLMSGKAIGEGRRYAKVEARIIVGPAGDAYLCGTFEDSLPLDRAYFDAAGESDGFIARLATSAARTDP